MKGLFFLVVVFQCVFWWPPCDAAVVSDEKAEEMFLMLQNINKMLIAQDEKLSRMEEKISVDLKALADKLDAQDTKLSAIKGYDELLLSTQKCSAIHDFIANQSKCGDGVHKCSEFAKCIPTQFSHECVCLDGFVGNGFHCEDINECLNDDHGCHELADCINTPGSYTCNCTKPYGGDGRKNCEFRCEDYPNSAIVEDLGCLHFTKNKMTWEDSRLYCSSIGMRLAENITREHLESIWKAFGEFIETHNGIPYLWMWVGGKGHKWITIDEYIQYEDYLLHQPDDPLDYCIYLYIQNSFDDQEGFGDLSCDNADFPLCQYIQTIP